MSECSGQSFVEEVLAITKASTLQWCAILERLGMDAETASKWENSFKSHVQELHQDLIQSAEEVQNKLVESIEQLLRKSEELCKELHIKMPSYGSADLSLFNEKKFLQSRINEYESKISARRNELAVLRKRQLEVCQCLGYEPKLIPDSPLPTQDEISEVVKHIEYLEGEKFKREERYLEVKSEILGIVNELGIKPSLDLEKVVVSQDDSSFPVTDFNMKWVEEYYLSLVEQSEQTKIEISNLRDTIRFLWELLSEDIKTCGEFLDRHTGNSLQTLEALQLEVRRCEDLKKANIEKFVKKLRDEIVILWGKCHFSAVQREEFAYFHSSTYTEDLLTLHDMEIVKLNTYYNDNVEIFNLLEKREQYWKKMLEIEERATAPGRFKNRGGQLLREEKERNRLQKSLPGIETRLVSLAEDYERRVGEPFLSRGYTIADIIEQSYENHTIEKKQKLCARKQQRELTVLTPGKSCLSLAASSSHKNLFTPSAPSSNKRKVATPLFSSVKRRKGQTKGLLTDPPKLQVNDKTIVRRYSRHSQDRKKRLDKIKRISKAMHKRKVQGKSESTTYNIFEEEVLNKQSCRSTLFQDPCCSATGAVPLPLTPKVSTPKRLYMRTPRIGLKLKTGVAGQNLNF